MLLLYHNHLFCKADAYESIESATRKTSNMRKLRQNHNPTGRTRRKGDFGNSESTGYRDPFRNGEIPLCGLLNDAIEDIFPELQDHGRNSNRGNTYSQQSRVESGSTLGQMIRKRYLLARKSYRASLDTRTKESKTNEEAAWDFDRNNMNFRNNNSINSNINNNNDTPRASTTAKKRRKRKKKKRLESDISFLPTVITHESGENDFASEPLASSLNGADSYLTGGKSMMSTTDHSLEALDEAVKNECEKLIELEANHELPLLGSLPSDDCIQAQESPSQFIDQIKPQYESLLQYLPDHVNPLPLTDGMETTTIIPLLEVDDIPANEEEIPLEIKWKDPLQLPFLVTVEGGKDLYRYSGNDSQATDSSIFEGSKNMDAFISDKERTRIILHEWIDQFFFVNDECECIETSVATTEQDGDDNQKDEWDSFLQFCNERTVGKEKASGIPLRELVDNASSIESRVCRVETLAEINKIAGNESSSASVKSPRIVMNPTVLENPTPQATDQSIDAAFDYVALEEGNHIPKKSNDEQDEEKLDSNISFLVTEVIIDSKQKKGNKKKNQTGTTTTAERYLYLETLSSEQLEEFLCEWLIAGVDEEKLVQMSIRKETEACENDVGKTAFPVVASDVEIQGIKHGVIKTQLSLKESLHNMNSGLERMRCEWQSKNAITSIEKNLDFSGNNTMESCEGSCIEYLTEDILPILIGEFSLPSHACAELQIHLWAVYLEGLGKTLNACDVYYKKLEEDLADQNGKLPFIFTSAPFRKIYRELAEEKIVFLSQMGKSFSTATSSSSMREFYTRSSWEHSKRDNQDASSQKLDEDCRKLIIELTEWTRIVNGGRMSTIIKQRSRRLLTVFNMLGVVVESLGEEYKTVEGYFSQERQNYFSRLLSNIHLAHGVKDRMRLLEMDDVISLTTGITLMWRHVRIMQSRVSRTISTVLLPLSLRKWILESPDIDSKTNEKYQFSPDLCWPGIGGRRRLMGILAGLTYAWFRERCKEWKAEKASQELLTYFDTDLLSGVDQKLGSTGSIIKSRKKTKKKKNKKSSSLANGFSNNSISSSDERIDEVKSDSILDEVECAEGILVDKSPEVAKQESADDTEIPIIFNVVSVGNGRNLNSNTVISEANGKVNDLNTNETTRSINDVDGVENFSCEKEDNNAIEPFESLVVVEDESGCIVPAMEFLADRLVTLMRQPENEKIVIL